MQRPSSDDDIASKLALGYRLLFEKNPLPMWVYDAHTLRMLSVNEAALSCYGYTPQDVVGLTLLDLHPQDDLAAVREQLQQPMTAPLLKHQWRHQRRGGELLDVQTVTSEVTLDGQLARIMLVRDISEQSQAEQSGHALNARLAVTLESITDAFFTLDHAGCFTYLNTQAEQLLKKTRHELLGANICAQFEQLTGTIFQTQYEEVVAAGKPARFETWCAPLGAWLSVQMFPSEEGLTVNFRDVTEQHLIEQRLLEERELLAAIVNSSNDAIISTDAQGVVKMFNPGAERIFQRTQASMQGQGMALLLPERYRETHRQQMRAFAQSHESTRMMGLGLVKCLRADGQEIDIEGSISQVRVQGQQVLIANLKDVTQRVRADAEFAQSREQLSELTERLMTQEKSLVKGLAQALHDQLGQTMAAIRMAHETVLVLQNELVVPANVQRLQAQMGLLIAQAVRQIRQVLVDLRPPLLDEHGLAAALDNELRNRSLKQPKLDISVHVAPAVALMRWPSEVEYAAFMVAREAVENCLRHAHASALAVSLSGSSQALQLEVIDNGVGIATDTASRMGHLGMVGMHERAQVVGASVTVEPAQPQGTRVCFNWQPLPLM